MRDKTVARLNIERYRKLLGNNEEDETRRQMLVRLLAEEERKVAALDKSEIDVRSVWPIRANG
jgi:hypothetical protein